VEFKGKLIAGTYSSPTFTTFTHWAKYDNSQPSEPFSKELRDLPNSEHALSVCATSNPASQLRKSACSMATTRCRPMTLTRTGGR
jgi:hypothetical protein